MDFLFQNKKQFTIVALALLLAMNYAIVIAGLDSDFFGILFSTVLFFIGGRTTHFKISYLLIGLIVIFEFVSYRLHTKSLHFLSLMLLVCWVYYSFTKKFSFIAFICLLLFSTLFNKFFEHLTTEIKQALCQIVFLTLKDFMTIDRIEGVNFYIDGAKITIDTACIGLSMFRTGLLTGALLLTLEERKSQKYFGIMPIVIFCFVVVLLNIISNYFRIVTLIVLGCTQENMLHHAIGLLCFALYQVVPMVFLIRFFKPKMTPTVPVAFQVKVLPVLFIMGFMAVTSVEIKNGQQHHLLDNVHASHTVQKGTWVNDEVFKIETPNKLTYIKAPMHKPLVCWTGDGYKIVDSKEVMYGGQKVWYNLMEKDGAQYASYWWYECGNKKYTSFIEAMLIKLIYNRPIRLINETSRI